VRSNKVLISQKDLKELYFDKKLSYKQIADLYNCTKQTVCNRFKECNLKARTYSESLLGRSILWKDKIRISNTGKKRPGIGGAKKGIIPWNKNKRKATHNALKNTGMQKQNHWNWKGGISDLCIRIRQLSQYKLWREQIFEKNDYTCQECFHRGGDLEAHHKKEFNIILEGFLNKYNQFSPIEDKETLLRLSITYPPFWDVDNGITLCEECHKIKRRIK